MFLDVFKEIIWSLSANKVRSGLTVLGIVIGIASVITMVAIGEGAKNEIEKNIESIGSNLIIVIPGFQRGSAVSQGRGSSQTLTVEDADSIRKEVPNVKAVAPEISRRYQISAKGNNTNTQVIGTVGEYLIARNLSLNRGNFFSEQQIKGSARVAVLGSVARDDLFGVNTYPVGQYIKIKNTEFQIIGIMQAKGGSGFSNPDDAVYVPITSAQHYLSGDAYVNTISVAASSRSSMSLVQASIERVLSVRHGISASSQPDFTLMNQNDIIATATSITGTFTMLLSSIAGISLLVGGIGIMNMMLTTVTERTREIGLRKAVGIRKIYIHLQFLGEAVVLTFLGGLLGILLGWAMSAIITHIVSSLSAEISFSAVILAFGVSASVGIIFGFYPARKAAKLSPIEALRYE